jgi:uncharacterized damage-inducible protein DinB
MTRRRPCPMCRLPHHRLGSTPPLTALARAPRRLGTTLARIPPRLVARRPGRGSWAVNEVLCHLADAEVALAFRLRKIASEPGQAIAAWDQDRWAEGGRYRRARAREAHALWSGLRAANLAYLRRVGRAARALAGRHPEYGRMTIDQLLDHFAEHDLIHLEQILAAVATLRRR